MAESIDRIVNLIFKATDRMTAPVRSMARAVDGATKMMGSALRGLGSVIGGVIDWVGKIGLAMNTVRMVANASVSSIRDGFVGLTKQLEETKIRLAGTATAFGLADSFAEGTKQADRFYKQIEHAAAVLPGELDDYMAFFEYGLPKALEAGLNPDKIVDFTSQFGAVALSMGIDTRQAALDLQRILGAQAGMDVRTWTMLAPLIGKSAEEWNKMSAPERLAGVQAVLGEYAPMVDNFAKTATTLEGTVATQIKTLRRAVGAPVLEYWKGSLERISVYLTENSAALERMSAVAGKKLVAGFQAMERAAVGIYRAFQAIGAVIKSSGIGEVFAGAASAIGGAVSRVASTIQSEGVRGAMQISPAGGALLGVFDGLAAAGERLRAAWPSMLGAIESAAGALAVVGGVAYQIGAILAQAFLAVLPHVTATFAIVGDTIKSVFDILAPLVSSMLDRLRPTFVRFVDLIGKIARIIGAILKPLIIGLAHIVGKLVTTVFDQLEPVVSAVVWLLDKLADGILWVLDKIPGVDLGRREGGGGLGGMFAAGSGSQFNPDALLGSAVVRIATNVGEKFGSALDDARFKAKFSGFSGKEAVRNKPPGGKVQYDFRNSRFSIEQSFAEGFDPARVSVGFAQDLAKLGELRTQASTAPLYSPRR